MGNRNYKIVILISCMHEENYEILARTNVQTDAIVINQCNRDSIEYIQFIDKYNNSHNAIFVCTTQRGLSKSRNLALNYAVGYDICIVCDDDEVLTDNYEKSINEVYNIYPTADVIAFSIKCDQYTRVYPTSDSKLSFFDILKTSSQQITFKYQSLKKHSISFDEKMGSGTGNGPGEETKLLLTCRNKGFNMRYSPFCLAKINKGDSKWFHGYTEKYFENQGWTDRRLLGSFLGLIYIFYWSIFRRSEYKADGLSVMKAIKHSLIGYFTKR